MASSPVNQAGAPASSPAPVAINLNNFALKHEPEQMTSTLSPPKPYTPSILSLYHKATRELGFKESYTSSKRGKLPIVVLEGLAEVDEVPTDITNVYTELLSLISELDSIDSSGHTIPPHLTVGKSSLQGNATSQSKRKSATLAAATSSSKSSAEKVTVKGVEPSRGRKRKVRDLVVTEETLTFDDDFDVLSDGKFDGEEAEEEEDLLLYGDSNDKTFSSRSSNPSGQVSGNKDQPSTRREQEALAANAANQPQRGGKKRNNSNNSSTSKAKSDIWNMEESEERKRVKEFWLSLSEESRNALIRLEKEAVLRKMKEQQKHTCTCSVCGRRRTAIEEELEMLYDAYYEELERYTEKQGEPGGFNFFKNLGVKGTILTVADDLMKNEGKKFLDMMERLAERRIRRDSTHTQSSHNSNTAVNGKVCSDDGDDEESTNSEDSLSEEQRLEEGKRMFQMFAAKMFEQRILSAYREKIALEKQQKLIEEEEELERRAKEKRERERKKREAKKQRRRQKQLEEEERKRKEKEEALAREMEERRKREAEEAMRRKEEEKRKQEELRAQQEEEKRRQEQAAATDRDTTPKQSSAQNRYQPSASAAPSVKNTNATVAEVDSDLPAEGSTKKKKKKRNKKGKKQTTDDSPIPGLVKPETTTPPTKPASVAVDTRWNTVSRQPPSTNTQGAKQSKVPPPPQQPVRPAVNKTPTRTPPTPKGGANAPAGRAKIPAGAPRSPSQSPPQTAQQVPQMSSFPPLQATTPPSVPAPSTSTLSQSWTPTPVTKPPSDSKSPSAGPIRPPQSTPTPPLQPLTYMPSTTPTYSPQPDFLDPLNPAQFLPSGLINLDSGPPLQSFGWPTSLGTGVSPGSFLLVNPAQMDYIDSNKQTPSSSGGLGAIRSDEDEVVRPVRSPGNAPRAPISPVLQPYTPSTSIATNPLLGPSIWATNNTESLHNIVSYGIPPPGFSSQPLFSPTLGKPPSNTHNTHTKPVSKNVTTPPSLPNLLLNAGVANPPPHIAAVAAANAAATARHLADL